MAQQVASPALPTTGGLAQHLNGANPPAYVVPFGWFNVKAYGALGDTIAYVATTSITSGAATLTVTAGTFAAGDVGKTIVVPGAGAAGADLKTTISAVGSTTSITLAANASTTLTSASKTLTYGTDDTTAINSAIAALNTAGAGVLYFPASATSYLCTAALTALTACCTVRGDGSAIANTATTFGSLVQCYGAAVVFFTVNSLWALFRDLAITNVAGATPTSASKGIYVTSAQALQCVCYDTVRVSGFYTCVDVAEGSSWWMRGCFVHNFVTTGLAIANGVVADNGDWSISDTQFWADARSSTAAAISQVSAGGGKITNCKFNLVGSSGGTLDRAINTGISGSVQTSILQVSNCSMENLTYGIVVTTTGSGCQFNNVLISNCQIQTNGAGSVAIYLAADVAAHIDRVTISGCILQNSHGGGSSNTAILVSNVTNSFIGGSYQLGYTALIGLVGTTTGATHYGP